MTFAALEVWRTVKTPMRFLLLVFALSMPFYVLGVSGHRLPGLPILPLSALMTFTPMVAAAILVCRRHGAVGLKALLRRAYKLRWYRHAGWVLTALLVMPIVCILEFAVLKSIGSSVPVPVIAPGYALVLFAAFFIGAVGEELGWQGYAYPALRVRWGALRSAIAVGVVWALWHIIPYVQLGRSLEWILWHSLSAVALRIIIVWLFENSGTSVLVAVLFHAMINVSWALFPDSGSYYDPAVTFAILILIVGTIIARWGKSLRARDTSCYRHWDNVCALEEANRCDDRHSQSG